MKKILKMLWQGIVILWEDYLLQLRFIFYILVIIFLIVGVIAVFTDGVAPGIFLIVLNGLLLLLMRRLDKASDDRFDRNFQEMVRKNREDQNPSGGEKRE